MNIRSAALVALAVSAAVTACQPALEIEVRYGDGEPVSGAGVTLDGQPLGETSDKGQLVVDHPAPGTHLLVVRKGSESEPFSHEEREVEISGTGVTEVPLTLVRPIVLGDPLSVAPTQVHLSWVATNDPKFLEYRVYVGHVPALDESTGRLVRIITDGNQTQEWVTNDFTGPGQNILPNADHYFRVYVLRSDGSMAGSNILKVRTPLWDNADQLTTFYRLEQVTSFAGAASIHGLAWDGQYLWLLYRTGIGGYYDPDQLSLVQYDYTQHATLRTLPFQDYSVPAGLVWDGKGLWVSFQLDNHPLQWRNPDTGAVERTFAQEYGTVGLAWTGSSLIINKYWPKTLAVDPVTGGIQREIPNPFHHLVANWNRDVAYRPGELWMSNNELLDIVIVNDAGQHIGIARSPHKLVHMEFIGPDLLAASTEDSQVHILRVLPGP